MGVVTVNWSGSPVALSKAQTVHKVLERAQHAPFGPMSSSVGVLVSRADF